jgi:hypothetical protein
MKLFNVMGSVPADVPLLDHSSTPLVPSTALKKSVPLTFVRKRGLVPVEPGKISLTIVVAAGVPLLDHNS